ncbi:hypothetical protein TNCV_2760451 [Trichonephila clavipes]|nr:hypothetical protein TNCV_2760451 [Trichonephila clavipes]
MLFRVIRRSENSLAKRLTGWCEKCLPAVLPEAIGTIAEVYRIEGNLNFRGQHCQEYTKNIWIVDKKTSDWANCKGQLALIMQTERDHERRLKSIVRSHRTHILAQITSQLNDGASRTFSKQTVQRSLQLMGFGSCLPTRLNSLLGRYT